MIAGLRKNNITDYTDGDIAFALYKDFVTGWGFFAHPKVSRMNKTLNFHSLTSPYAKRAGPKGLRAESTVGGGKTFWAVSQIFLQKTAVTPERKVKKWFPRWEINRHAEG